MLFCYYIKIKLSVLILYLVTVMNSTLTSSGVCECGVIRIFMKRLCSLWIKLVLLGIQMMDSLINLSSISLSSIISTENGHPALFCDLGENPHSVIIDCDARSRFSRWKSFSLFLFVGNFYLECDYIVSDTFSVSTGVAIYFSCSILYGMCYIICDVLYKLLFIC